MARPAHGRWVHRWPPLDRGLLHQQHQVPNPSYRGLEYGCWLRFRCLWLQPRHALAIAVESRR